MPVVIQHTGSQGLTAVSFEQVTVSTVVLALAIPSGIVPKRVVLTVHTNAIRVRWDGVDPSTTVGHLLSTGSGPLDITRGIDLLGRGMIERFRMIRNAAADSEVAYTIEV